MAAKNTSTLTQERLKELLHYDPETGDFTWRVARGRAKVGDVVGSANHGYVKIKIDYTTYLAHRLAWLYVHGAWPADQLDHRNGVHDNNWIDNLREATNAENHQNRAPKPNSTSKFLGVRWDNRRVKWLAEIRINYKLLYLGRFDTEEEAHAAYRKAKAELHKFQPVPRE